MDETTVQLLCPECMKTWRANPIELPEPSEPFTCPDCESTKNTSEFMQTNRDFQTLKQFGKQ